MNAEAYRDEGAYREATPDVINIKRNPYLVDYEQQRRLRSHREQRIPQSQEWQERQRESRRASQRNVEYGVGREAGRASRRPSQMGQEAQWGQEVRRPSQRVAQRGTGIPRKPETEVAVRKKQAVQVVPQRERIGQYPEENTLTQARRKRAAMEKRRAAARRKRIVKMQRMVLFAGVFCIALLCGILYMERIDVKADEPGSEVPQQKVADDTLPVAPSSGLVQGLAAAQFAKHPEWEEKFLTPNEYSRPGDALEEVNSIFVHYTANPNTSAAQNRSYFEQLKDTHITSASAHFIIGYNGEIIQCIPLDEIAYAVQTRNFDSISIECCYKSADGSFTQETYDSLIELLAWLTDTYDLKTDDILRHYDCGGKKCPIYYTEHEDAWERLKKDVGEKL